LNADSNIDDIIDFFTNHGVADYAEILKEFQTRVEEAHHDLANWQSADFKYLCLHEEGDVVYNMSEETAPGVFASSSLRKVEAAKKSEVVAGDKLVLQNYGRPYNGARPGGTFYKFARPNTEPLPLW